MKPVTVALSALMLIGLCHAEDDQPAGTAAPTTAAQPVTDQQLRHVPEEPTSTPASPDHLQGSAAGTDGADKVLFDTEARWSLAGYNMEEVVYTILITNHDARILRCSTLLAGSYYENGIKLPISDRQSITIFPDQQLKAGTWLGMDEKSGATYSVKCRAI